jgi:hypothetical protein
MKTEVSLTCSQATIQDPRTTMRAPSSPKLLDGLTDNTDATGSPKHPLSLTPNHAKRNHGCDRNPRTHFHHSGRGHSPLR